MSLVETQDLLFLLTLPEHYQRTVLQLVPQEWATAEDVANRTGRARAVESSYLNNLTVMGVVNKERRGRKAYFLYRHANSELSKAVKRLRKLSTDLRKLVLEDTLTALNNRITVFEQIKSS